MIGAAGAAPADQVAIAGPRLDLLIGLVRRGFSGAICVSPHAPVCSETFDTLFISDTDTPERLRKALPRLLRGLHPGGTAVLHQPLATPSHERRELRRALQDCGLAALGETDSADGVLLTARKPGTIRLGQVA
ncbi:MAG: hypothetical protein WDN69_03320 [Aliidongia sp.]